jgi:hypothetical protein
MDFERNGRGVSKAVPRNLPEEQEETMMTCQKIRFLGQDSNWELQE